MKVPSRYEIAAIAVAGALAMAPGAAFAQNAMQSQQNQNAAPEGTVAHGTAVQIPLDKVNNAKQTLSSASVEDADGNSVGSVKAVDTNAQGAPTAINVDVGGFLGVGSKTVRLHATNLKYEQDRNVIITNMTKDQIKALPTIGT